MRNQFVRPEPARERVVTMGAALRLSLAVLLLAIAATLVIVREATGWAPIQIDAPATSSQPREVWA